MISSGINLVMTVIRFAVSTMFIVFLCTRLVGARIHLSVSRRSFPIASRSYLNILERGLHGIEPVVITNFPTKKYSDAFFSAVDDAQCTVCLSEYRNDDVLRILPYCEHPSLHVTCIDIWLQQHSTCPVCRISLREFPERKRRMQPLFCSAIRSHYGTESFNTLSYRYLLNSRASRTHENCGMDPIREDHATSEGDATDARENSSPLTESNEISKDSGNKHVESPSNP